MGVLGCRHPAPPPTLTQHLSAARCSHHLFMAQEPFVPPFLSLRKLLSFPPTASCLTSALWYTCGQDPLGGRAT